MFIGRNLNENSLRKGFKGCLTWNIEAYFGKKGLFRDPEAHTPPLLHTPLNKE